MMRFRTKHNVTGVRNDYEILRYKNIKVRLDLSS